MHELVTIGQATMHTTVALDRPLAVHDQTTGRFERGLGGTAAIVAHNAAALALTPVSFSGHAGEDPAGDAALRALRTAGVRVGALTRDVPSPQIVVLVGPDGERTMVAAPGAPRWESLTPDVCPGDIAFFEGWHLFEDTGYMELIRAARARGATIALDVCSATRARDARRHARLLRAIRPDILLANDAEAAAYALEPAPPETVLLVHAGAEPTRVWEAGRCTRHAVLARTPVDTSGAGDTFAAGLLAALAGGLTLDTALAIAHRAAGDVVGLPGALLVTSRPAPAGNRHGQVPVHAPQRRRTPVGDRPSPRDVRCA